VECSVKILRRQKLSSEIVEGLRGNALLQSNRLTALPNIASLFQAPDTSFRKYNLVNVALGCL